MCARGAAFLRGRRSPAQRLTHCHACDHLLVSSRRHWGIERHEPQPKTDDPITDSEHVLEVVADHDDSETLLRDGSDELEGRVRLGKSEGRRRFIQHEDSRATDHRPSDRDGLALAAGQPADGRTGVRDAPSNCPMR